MRMKYPTSMDCNNNLEVEKDLQSNIDNVLFEESRKTLKNNFEGEIYKRGRRDCVLAKLNRRHK